MDERAVALVARELGPSAGCPVGGLIYLLSGRWMLAILFELHTAGRPLRFTQISAKLEEVSPGELSRALKRLEAMKLITRKAIPGHPPRVDYEVSEVGLSLWPELKSLEQWLSLHREAILATDPSQPTASRLA